MEVILASTNLHKIREFKDLLKPFTHIEFLSLLQFPHFEAPEETGLTFQENAILKAEYAAKTLNKWALADDSGLVVPALKGEPGVYSARYAGIGATDAENRKRLLQAMEDLKTPERRSAYYECCLAIAGPSGEIKSVTGVCEGYITQEEKGRNGFGYDPLFIKHDYDKTFAELEESVKNRISHRRKAFERLFPYLETLRDQ